MAIVLYLKLLGGVSVESQAGPLTGRAVQRRRLALLAILAAGQARGRGTSRERVVAYLWPEADAERGRPLLSDSVYRINQAVGGEAIVAVGDELRLNDAIVSSDVADFERAIEVGDRERAAALYAGALLDGFYLVNNAEFERWHDGERARLARAYEEVLDALAQTAESSGAVADAVVWWRRLADHDPYSSRVALRLMQALASLGDSAAAVRHAAVHSTLLQEELGVAPNAAVLRLAERLRAEPVEPLIETPTFPPSLRDSRGEVRGVRRRLGDATTFESNAKKAGAKIRISVQLSNADGFQLWSQSYDREFDDAFAIQEDICSAVVDMLHGERVVTPRAG